MHSRDVYVRCMYIQMNVDAYIYIYTQTVSSPPQYYSCQMARGARIDKEPKIDGQTIKIHIFPERKAPLKSGK